MTSNKQASKRVYIFRHNRCVVCGSRMDRINGCTRLVLIVGQLNSKGEVVQRQSVLGTVFVSSAVRA